ncbi:hypothetical protein MCG98_09970 [Ruminococcus sp. OA3]|uniref:hypothetical protein n=1 Tax=Ruminococcus sp. OA3 TaxID=2914164 RepID=UPI001F063FB5|nr:hypothetical protein [Ruminococcus sp. OA3]MCH1982889.1 hypothetical protein [Ruminococcus sp. OA3]
MKKYIVLLAGILFILLTGCGAAADNSTVTIDKKGRVTSVIVDSFDRSYYDTEKLESTVEKAVAAYNKEQDAEKVSMKQCRYDKKQQEIRLEMEYASCSDYEAFNQVTLFDGTITQAGETYDFEGKFLDAGGNETDIAAVRTQYPEARVTVTNEPVDVVTRGKILCVSENVKILGEKKARVEAGENQDNENAQTSIAGYAYIVYQ